jgi:hypothetical protein
MGCHIRFDVSGNDEENNATGKEAERVARRPA